MAGGPYLGGVEGRSHGAAATKVKHDVGVVERERERETGTKEEGRGDVRSDLLEGGFEEDFGRR